MCIFLLIAGCFDYRSGKIPNWLLAVMYIAGLGRSCLEGDGRDVLLFLITAVSLMLCLYPLFKIGTLGAGDVKLFGVCAGYLPSNKILYFLFYSLLIAAIISLIKLLVEQNIKERLRYFGEYILEVVRSGSWGLYMENERECRKAGVCLAGPIFCSILLYVGGVY